MTAPIHIIKKVPLFSMLSETDQQNLASLLRLQSIRKGEFIFHRGDEGTALYIILQGRIKISVSRHMDTVTLAILGQGEFLGEIALLDGLPRSADAAALEDSKLAVLNRQDFLTFLVNNEKAVFGIFSSLSMRLRKTDDLLAEMCFLNLSARLAQKLVELVEMQAPGGKNTPTYVLKLSQQELGNILGVSRESINKELKNLRKRGILSTSRNHIHIHNLELLKKRLP